MGIDPEQADFPFTGAEVRRDSGYRSGGYGVISSEDEGNLPTLQTCGDQFA
jgi:hypothetical protein